MRSSASSAAVRQARTTGRRGGERSAFWSWPQAGLLARAVSRVAHGRPAVLTARVLIVAAVGAASESLVGSAPATPALISGALTWFVLTARRDLAPPGSS